MNSLEFIDEKIKKIKQSIRHWEMQLKNYPNDEVFTRFLNNRKEDLQAFQEVKAKLEAWEVVKKRRSYAYITYKNLFDLSVMMSIDDPDCEKLLKALEVSNVKDKR